MERFPLISLYLFAPPQAPGGAEVTQQRTATLVRMVLPDHICPFGVRAKQLLERNGFEIEERILGSREEADAFKEEQGVETTPQIFIDGERIGGSDELERLLGNEAG
jgi:glutaredoxin 3